MFQFTGLDPTYKVPRFIGKIIFSAGPASLSSQPLYALYIGQKTVTAATGSNAGTMVADSDVLEVFNEDQIDSLAGSRSLLAAMARAGLRAAPTSRHFIAALADPVGATAATATLVLGGTIGSSGEWALTIAGIRFTGVISTALTLDDIGNDMATKITARTRLPVVAAYVSATKTLTITAANPGAQGTNWTIQIDKTLIPTGMTAVLTGSAALSGNRVKMGAGGTGVGTTDVTTILSRLAATRYARIALQVSDNTNASLVEAYLNDKATMLKLLLEQAVFATSGTLTQAQSLARTGLNAQRAQVLWMPNADIHPAVIAAVKTAIRASTEGADWVPDYDGLVLPGIPGHLSDTDVPSDSEQNIALNTGVTPITSAGGNARVVRSITSYCLLNDDLNMPDERTLDIGDAICPDNVLLDLMLLYNTEFRAANKYVRDDPKANEFEPPTGVGHPKLWTKAVMYRLLGYFQNGWIEDPNLNPPQSQFNRGARAIESQLPLIVSRVQHSLRQIVRQQAPAI